MNISELSVVLRVCWRRNVLHIWQEIQTVATDACYKAPNRITIIGPICCTKHVRSRTHTQSHLYSFACHLK